MTQQLQPSVLNWFFHTFSQIHLLKEIVYCFREGYQKQNQPGVLQITSSSAFHRCRENSDKDTDLLCLEGRLKLHSLDSTQLHSFPISVFHDKNICHFNKHGLSANILFSKYCVSEIFSKCFCKNVQPLMPQRCFRHIH